MGVGETATGCGESTKAEQLQELQDRLSHRFRPWSRSAQFWVRAADIYSSYKVCQLRAGFVKEEREALWEQQHELGAQKMYSLCSELGGLFLKIHTQETSLSARIRR